MRLRIETFGGRLAGVESVVCQLVRSAVGWSSSHELKMEKSEHNSDEELQQSIVLRMTLL